jgi:hypothetical protein
MIIKKLKNKRKIICYIKKSNDTFFVNTGKPSDDEYIQWSYDSLEDAEKTANEYFNNYVNKK